MNTIISDSSPSIVSLKKDVGAAKAFSYDPGERPRFLSEADCHDIANRLARFSQGGGYTEVTIRSTWTGNVRWARNQVISSGDVRNNYVIVDRNLNGADSGWLLLNDTSDAGLIAAARRAERMSRLRVELAESDLKSRYQMEPFTAAKLFSESTYQLDADKRAGAAKELAQSSVDAGMLSAGYIEVSAHSIAVINTLGLALYFPFTQAQYSVTVRDPKGTGSGWAGVDWYDWSKIDGMKLSKMALDKCMVSRNPVAIEPGRYTTILEPQAVCDFVCPFMAGSIDSPLDRKGAEYHSSYDSPFRKQPEGPGGTPPSFSHLGDRVMDERISISDDPTDPEMGVAPFDNINGMDVYHPTTWIKDGVLVNLSYNRAYGRRQLGLDTGLPNSGAFRMSGGPTSIEEMISTTTRGLLVTRFDNIHLLSDTSTLTRGTTRDGLWLIEKGKISKPVKNLTFTQSILVALNSVEQLGVPQRVFHPLSPIFLAHLQAVIVPPLKIRDFSFTALDDAI